MSENWTETTGGYWQDLLDGLPADFRPEGPFRLGYPARLPDGKVLMLPLRQLPPQSNRVGDQAVASFLANQAGFAVVEALAGHIADLLRPLRIDIIVGMPTLGLTFAPLVARNLGHSRYVPLGYSRKFWYDENLSQPASSITSPQAGKRLYLDPHLRPLLQARRVALLDDAVSTGSTMVAGVQLLRSIDIDIAAIAVAMKQTNRWIASLQAVDESLPALTRAAFGCPLFSRSESGWVPVPETMPVLP